MGREILPQLPTETLISLSRPAFTSRISPPVEMCRVPTSKPHRISKDTWRRLVHPLSARAGVLACERTSSKAGRPYQRRR